MRAMKDTRERPASASLGGLRLRLLWLLLILLAAFVLFVEFIAEAGGSGGPVYPSPAEERSVPARPTPRSQLTPQDDLPLGLRKV